MTYLIAAMFTFFLLPPSSHAYKWIGRKPQLPASSKNFEVAKALREKAETACVENSISSRLLSKSVGSAMIAIMVGAGSAMASSGGGLDYANANLKEQGIIDLIITMTIMISGFDAYTYSYLFHLQGTSSWVANLKRKILLNVMPVVSASKAPS